MGQPNTLQLCLARFAAFIRANSGTWSQQDREMAAEKLSALAVEIEGSL